MAAQNLTRNDEQPITSIEELAQAIQAGTVDMLSMAPLVASLCPGATLVQSDYLRAVERAAWTNQMA